MGAIRRSGGTNTVNTSDIIISGFTQYSNPLDVVNINWQSGNTIRYTFNTDDLASVILGDVLVVTGSTNALNNGNFDIVGVSNTVGSKYIDVTNTGRSNNSLDETNSPAVANRQEALRKIKGLVLSSNGITYNTNTVFTSGNFIGTIQKNTSTKAEVLAMTPILGGECYTSDTKEKAMSDGVSWYFATPSKITSAINQLNYQNFK